MRKAGKQFDKFSQSIGERLFKEGKTEHSSAFRDLEQDIELRTRGMERLALASSTYIRSTGKKSKSEDPETSDGGKVLPGEGLGLVMISFGEQLGRDSDYGKSLVQMGRAKCKIAAIQDSYVQEIGEGYLAGLERAMDQIKDYQSLRKKLDSRRLAMDAATKRAASSKKDNRALEEEVRTSKARYDETQEDVEARMATIYESEGSYLDDLNSFLEAEVSFIDRYRDALVEAKNSLGSTSSSSRPSLPQRRPTLPSSSSRPRSSPPHQNDDPDDEPTPAISGNRARSNSTKSGDGKEKKSLFGSLRSKKSSTPRKDTWGALSEDQDGLSGRRGEDESEEEERERERERENGRPEVSALSAGNRSRSFSSATVMMGSSLTPAPGFPRRNTTPMRMETGEKTVR
ncbi:hypothetical protein BDY24DRAFT_395773 [Mrakia frigida]|uniref:uncharacterized protein n=1 Tax=Mrakia frigida TaxID=29902 RepID=UPI003FCC068F